MTLLPCSSMARPICLRRCGRVTGLLSRLPGEYIDLDRDAFMEHYYAYVYVRILQALGAYGFRGFYERKAHFLQSVPYALKNLRWLAHNVRLPVALPALMEAGRHVRSQRSCRGWLRPIALTQCEHVDFSFSFHSGSCQPIAGNGGGFVFDARACRTLDGRSFNSLTGKDEAVIDYLNRHASVHQYLSNVLSLVDASVASISNVASRT